MERYRSGHNGLALKACVTALTRHGGSNPSRSARIAAHFYGDGIYENQIWQLEETTKINFKNLLTKAKYML